MFLYATMDNPVPEGAVCGGVTTQDGVQLRFARWRPASVKHGTVCLFPGRTEKIEKYFETVRDLTRRGFAVAAMDWRGQGGSQRLLRNPMKGHVGSFDEYQNDLQAFMRQIVLPDCPPPYFALAHSMGSAILLDAARHGRRWFDRMMLVAPMLDLSLLKHDVAARRMARLCAGVGMSSFYVPRGRKVRLDEVHFEGNRLTSDPMRFARNLTITMEQPGLDVGPPTIGWVRAAFQLMDTLTDPATARKIRQPLLMVAAGADSIVSTPAIEHLGTRLIAGAHLVIPGARHELLQERDVYREPLFAAFDAFIPGSGG
ncbi:alpha/beta fold hydrolase [Ancylobacter mangrovi]|uniref:Alpha/beta hydrolase n=1 Tax=Ancylobacter mangrovi TaxID=2972472 RepID=A0A9X2PJP4_9HYPH|nr:alpha/beta hydrolase [Ancylobacter mangrovi]MCS0497325.1 alpha/beta hydrolase [Ancylobacter mangrovi]MCS0504124.1 alpha/beta hydrolase [Ancylobacter mangrovi]